MEKKKNKPLGTVVICAFLVAAFVAAVKAGVGAVCVTINGGDPFWVIFGLLIWGSTAGLIWLVACMVWENEI